MTPNAQIIVTGAAGFIGSCLVGYLNELGFRHITVVDDFSDPEKVPNLQGKHVQARIEREQFFEWLAEERPAIDFFFHLGARTDTTEFDYSIHEHLNVEYSKKVWNYCRRAAVPLVYASSAATYGNGEHGYNDDHESPFRLQPLNAYGISKNEFDKWAIRNPVHPPFWAGLKFFNVYGPNEYHKARMASVIFHAVNQIRSTGEVKLFKSHKDEFADGEQLRDFVYVMDLLKVCVWMMDHRPESGLYNLGTGKARSFIDLTRATFAGLELEPRIRFIDMPEDIREKYQYFTEANMSKLRDAGYTEAFYSLEDGVDDYVRGFLAGHKYY
jgi:ADP-L-glycero-D-manno-heptose 6-epimerase